MESEEARSLEEEILKVVSSEKLEELIREKGEQFHGLLTREAALFAISKEMKVAARRNQSACPSSPSLQSAQQ